jgi:hypothetical protein
LLRSGFSPKVLALRLSRMTAMPRLFCTLLLLLASLNCRAADPAQLALVLYPEAAQWLPASQLKPMSVTRFNGIKWLLRKHYLDQVRSFANEESVDCSFITRTLDEAEPAKYFYQADINADGAPEIIYTGTAQCREGDLSLIWYGAPTGLLSDKISRLPGKLQFIQPQAKPQIISYMDGCCGDPLVTYNKGELGQALLWDYVPGGLALPSTATSATGPLTAKGGVTLRSSPQRQDQYDQGWSENFLTAKFGNISQRYLPGASLQQLQRYQDAQDVEWLLVRMDKASEVLAVHNPLNASIGWVEASCLQGPCSGPDFNSAVQ